jgi:anti-sigma28 factor (negative regulator of flagellin synthesis)
MSMINSIGNNGPTQPIVRPGTAKTPSVPAQGQMSRTDNIEFSSMDRLMAHLKANDIRAEKVASIKAQIDAGTYEDDYKLDVATNRLLDDLTE